PEGIVEQPFETTRGGIALRGSIWLPPKPGAKVPLVVFVAGSGPTDRDGNSALGLKSDVYRLMADALARKGVASLRYDKRGIGRSGFGGGEKDVAVETVVDDAAARPDAKLVLLPKASHVFKDEASAALPQKSYTDPSLPLSAGVVDAMLSVLKK